MQIRKALLAVALVVCCTAAAGCGATTTSTPTSNLSTKVAMTTARAPVGGTLELTGQNQRANVQLLRVINPASPADVVSAPTAGQHLIALEFKVTSIAGTVQDNANDATSLVGSDDQTYQPTFANIVGCPVFDGGSFSVPTGQSTIGCVAFAVSNNVTVSRVNFALAIQVDGSTGQWDLP